MGRVSIPESHLKKLKEQLKGEIQIEEIMKTENDESYWNPIQAKREETFQEMPVKAKQPVQPKKPAFMLAPKVIPYHLKTHSYGS